MRILHLIYDDIHNPWLGGGGAAGTRYIAQFAAKKDYHTTILCGSYPGSKDTDTSSCRIIHLGRAYTYLMSRITFTLFSLIYLFRNVSKYDLIIDDVSIFSPTFSFLFKKRVPVIANIRNIFGKNVYSKFSFAGIIPAIIEKLTLNCYDHYIVVAPYMKKYVNSKANRFVVPNGLDFSEISSPAYNEKGRYLAFLGRIEIYQKGLDVLIGAIKIIAPLLRKNGYSFSFAGSGKDAHTLNKMLHENELSDICRLHGRVVGKDKYKFLKESLLTVCPSRYEAMPRVPLESQACGTPVIATDIPAFSFVVDKDETGFLVETGNVDQLAEKISLLLTDSELRETMAKKAYSFSKKFDRRIFLKQRIQIYDSIALNR
ncbi:MAG: glycosyltransferase family 4 protein [Chitinispirillaceae bacterium]